MTFIIIIDRYFQAFKIKGILLLLLDLRMAAAQARQQCSVGIYLNSECYLTSFTRKVEYTLRTIEDCIDKDLLQTIKFRTNLTEVLSISEHHYVAYTSSFNNFNRSRNCSDPLSLHTTGSIQQKVKSCFKTLNLELCRAIKSKKPDLHVYSNQNLCLTCYKALLNLPKQETSSSSELEDGEAALNELESSFFSPGRPIETSKKLMSLLGLPPVTFDCRDNKEQRLKTVKSISSVVAKKFVELYESVIDIVDDNSNKEFSISEADSETLLQQLKEKCDKLKSEENNSKVVSLLTLAPTSWPKEKFAKFFSVPLYQVKRSRILKSEKGILSIPDPKKGRAISNEEISIIQEFYRSDENSRETAGMKETVTVPVASLLARDREQLLTRKLPGQRLSTEGYATSTASNPSASSTSGSGSQPSTEGNTTSTASNPSTSSASGGEKRIKLQKRLLLMNVREMYSKYKEPLLIYVISKTTLVSRPSGTFLLLLMVKALKMDSVVLLNV